MTSTEIAIREPDVRTYLQRSLALEDQLPGDDEADLGGDLEASIEELLTAVAAAGRRFWDPSDRRRLEGILKRWNVLLPRLGSRVKSPLSLDRAVVAPKGSGELVRRSVGELRSMLRNEAAVSNLLFEGQAVELDLHEARIVDCRFVDCDFRGAAFGDGRFVYTGFHGCNFEGVDAPGFRAAECLFLGPTNFKDAVFGNAKLWGSVFKASQFTLDRSSFEEAQFTESVLDGLRLGPLEVFRRASFVGASLINFDADGADFTGAVFEAATFSCASDRPRTPSSVQFRGATLTGARFGGDLRHMSFRGSYLGGASFNTSKVREVDFSGAHLENADLSTVIDLRQARFAGREWEVAKVTADVRDALDRQARQQPVGLNDDDIVDAEVVDDS